jgi:hypothetical protein
MWKAAIVLASVPGVAMASPSGQSFNLDCSGRIEAHAADDVARLAAPARARLRIDLAARQWCRDDCATVWPIDRADDAAIGLTVDVGAGRDTVELVTLPELLWYSRAASGQAQVMVHGQCTRAPFSGFAPAP